MRWGRFEADGRIKYGIVREDEVELVIGSPFAGYEPAADHRPLDSLRLLTPAEPRTFYAAGLNYLEHIREQARSRGREPDLPRQADIGYRANNALIAHGETIVIPRDSEGPVGVRGGAGGGHRPAGEEPHPPKTRCRACSGSRSATT